MFRMYAASCRELADVVVIGHVHRAVDEQETTPRMIVLGGWQQRSSYLKVDAYGAQFYIEDDRPCDPGARLQAGSQSPTCGV